MFQKRILSLFLAVGLAGCSLRNLAIDQTAAILRDAALTFDTETDISFAKEAIPASLKTIEGFLIARGDQANLLRLLPEGYMNYAFGFIEDEAERLDEDDPERAEFHRKRALAFYLRARDFGLRLLAMDHEELANTLRQRKVPTQEDLLRVDEDGLPGLYWTAAPWAAAINVGKSDPLLVGELDLVRTLMQRCVEIDEKYYWAGPRIALGGIAAGTPVALGGQPEEAARNFTRAIEITAERHLMNKVLYARLAGAQNGDRAFFEMMLKEVLAADPDAEPRLALANRLAQRRAKRYLEQIDDLFL